jgi:hypothetical protein
MVQGLGQPGFYVVAADRKVGPFSTRREAALVAERTPGGCVVRAQPPAPLDDRQAFQASFAGALTSTPYQPTEIVLTAESFPAWELRVTDDGRRFARKRDGGAELEAGAKGIDVGLSAPGDYTDFVPRGLLLWLLEAQGDEC